jgi:hypothetical protein
LASLFSTAICFAETEIPLASPGITTALSKAVAYAWRAFYRNRGILHRQFAGTETIPSLGGPAESGELYLLVNV